MGLLMARDLKLLLVVLMDQICLSYIVRNYMEYGTAILVSTYNKSNTEYVIGPDCEGLYGACLFTMSCDVLLCV